MDKKITRNEVSIIKTINKFDNLAEQVTEINLMATENNLALTNWTEKPHEEIDNRNIKIENFYDELKNVSHKTNNLENQIDQNRLYMKHQYHELRQTTDNISLIIEDADAEIINLVDQLMN